MNKEKLFKTLIDTIIPLPVSTALKLLSMNEKEKFSTTSSSENNFGGVLAFFFLFTIISYLVAMLITWVRLVLKASTCGILEGITAFFLTSIYTSWKMGTLIGKDCTFVNKGSGSWF